MTKNEASITYYLALFKLVEVLLLIGIDIIVIIPLLFEKYYVYAGLFVAINIAAIKMDIEYFDKVKKETNARKIKPEDNEEELHEFLIALLKGVRGLVLTSVILISIILFGLKSINSDILRMLSIIVTGLLIRICLNIYLNKVRNNHLQI